jgi:hypothetical protein
MENAFTDERQRQESSELFSTRLASLPNELFDIILDNFSVEEIVKLWTSIGTRLFTNNVSTKVMERIYNLRVRYCENFTWDKHDPEDSLFILWALALLHCEENEDSNVKLSKIMDMYAGPARFVCPETLLLEDKTDKQHKPLTIIKSKTFMKGWKYSDSFMWIGKASRSPNEIVSKFLKVKNECLINRFKIWKESCGEDVYRINEYQCFIYSFDSCFSNVYEFDFNVDTFAATVYSVKDLLKRWVFQIKAPTNRYFDLVTSMVLCPIVIMNFVYDQPDLSVYKENVRASSILPIIDIADRWYGKKKLIHQEDVIMLKEATDHIISLLYRFESVDGLLCSLAKYISKPLMDHIKYYH